MNVLVVQNYAGTGLGQVQTALEEAGARIDLVCVHQGEVLPDDPGGYDAIVVLGGGQNALDDVGSPWLPRLAALMRSFADGGRSTLGVCLGSQILARAYDADNLIGEASEFGWHEVRLTPEGSDDPVLGVLPPAFPIFQWHDDTFTLPRGAVRLAGNDAAHNQAFRIGRAAYGIQFHFEADRQLVRDWSETFAGWIAERQPDWPRRHPAEEARSGAAADAAGLALARAWVKTIGR